MRTITMKTKFLAAIFLSFIIALSVHAQENAPLKMSYQAVVRDGTNQLLENKKIGMRISILQGSVTGSLVYSETHSPTTNTNGLVSVIIGDGRSTTGAIALIDWSQGPFFAEMEIDPAGGTNYSITSTTQLLSVPFALYAEKAGNGFDGQYESLHGKPDFAYVATTGNYEDLTNKPDFAYVATTGNYNDLEDKPEFADIAISGNYEDLSNKPEFANIAISGKYEDLKEKPIFANIAISGKYADLLEAPELMPIATSGKYEDLSGTPKLAEVATTGSYKSLTDTPKKVSELANDANYLVNEKQKLKLEGSSLSITDEKGATVNTIVLPSNSTGGVTDYEQLTNKPEGTKDGDLLYWNNSEKKWNILGRGLEGQILSVSNGKLNWIEPSFIVNTEAYSEGEVFYKNGKAEGIIIESNKMTRSGLLLALHDNTVAWGTQKKHMNATNTTDGTENMAAIAGTANWESNYPAFSVSRALGDSWYLPSIEELKLIQQNVDKFNEELTAAGGETLSKDFYWSSTERDMNYAYGVAFKEISIKDPNSAIQADEQYMTTTTVTSSTGQDSLVFVSLDIPIGERIEAKKDTLLGVRAIRKLSWSELTSKPTTENTYKVGDIYYATDKTTPLGIVYQVTENGAHGKVLSIKESNNSWEEAGKWCNAIGPAWLIPTEKEWQDIASLKVMLNTTLSSKAYPPLSFNANYWSSTEGNDSTEAICIQMQTNQESKTSGDFKTVSVKKTESALIRAIMEF